MFKVTAICNHKGSSIEGERMLLWSGRTKKQAESWLKKLQEKLGNGYSDYQIEQV